MHQTFVSMVKKEITFASLARDKIICSKKQTKKAKQKKDWKIDPTQLKLLFSGHHLAIKIFPNV